MPVAPSVCFLGALFLGGCALGSTVHPDGKITTHYLGYVAVERPATAGRIFSDDTSVLGVRIDKGLGIGYLRDRHLVVPLDCRLVVIVRDQAQIEHARAALETAAHACFVANPSTEETR